MPQRIVTPGRRTGLSRVADATSDACPSAVPAQTHDAEKHDADITRQKAEVKILLRRIEAVTQDVRIDFCVSEELLKVAKELQEGDLRPKLPLEKQVTRVADLYVIRFGRDFEAMVEMARRIEQRTPSKGFARAVRLELERRAIKKSGKIA